MQKELCWKTKIRQHEERILEIKNFKETREMITRLIW